MITLISRADAHTILLPIIDEAAGELRANLDFLPFLRASIALLAQYNKSEQSLSTIERDITIVNQGGFTELTPVSDAIGVLSPRVAFWSGYVGKTTTDAKFVFAPKVENISFGFRTKIIGALQALLIPIVK